MQRRLARLVASTAEDQSDVRPTLREMTGKVTMRVYDPQGYKRVRDGVTACPCDKY